MKVYTHVHNAEDWSGGVFQRWKLKPNVAIIPGVIFNSIENFFTLSDDLNTLKIDPVEKWPKNSVLNYFWRGSRVYFLK